MNINFNFVDQFNEINENCYLSDIDETTVYKINIHVPDVWDFYG